MAQRQQIDTDHHAKTSRSAEDHGRTEQAVVAEPDIETDVVADADVVDAGRLDLVERRPHLGRGTEGLDGRAAVAVLDRGHRATLRREVRRQRVGSGLIAVKIGSPW